VSSRRHPEAPGEGLLFVNESATRVIATVTPRHRLRVAGPDRANANTAHTFLGRTIVPVVNSVWDASPERGYGDTTVSLVQMKRFIRMQVDAIRNYASANAAPDAIGDTAVTPGQRVNSSRTFCHWSIERSRCARF